MSLRRNNRLRKKHGVESEVFTDSLNDILFILLMFFLIVSTIANPNVVKIAGIPRGSKDTKAKQNIMVSINKDQEFFIGTKKIEPLMLDSMLRLEIRKQRAYVDTPTVVINADTTALYGEVWRIMKIARRDTAKVVANVSN
jgi:biopolymer transport protein ExbD